VTSGRPDLADLADLVDLPTPALIVDRPRLTRNLDTMRQRAAALGVALRPHAKTARNATIVAMAVDRPGGGITVSTLREAEHFLEHGFTDLVYAVGIAPGKLGRAADLIERGAGLTLLLDSLAQARAVAAVGVARSLTIPVLLELDCDGHRSGLAPDDPALVELGRFAHATPGIALAGVLTHGGESYACTSTDAIAAMAVRERDAAVGAAARLRAAGLPCPIVSVGSTPTATFAPDLTGVTELRAGVHTFQDLVMAGLGVCTVDDIALSVLTAVIGHQPDRGWLITDGGWTSLSRDRGTAAQAVDQGYGLVCDIAGRPIPDLIVHATNQEHGIVVDRGGGPLDPGRFPVGTLLRVLPNHACATVAMHERYHVVDGGTAVVETLDIVRGW
jgi:D-serine deaminase-like pyridoxal phosphate-dependent protein